LQTPPRNPWPPVDGQAVTKYVQEPARKFHIYIIVIVQKQIARIPDGLQKNFWMRDRYIEVSTFNSRHYSWITLDLQDRIALKVGLRAVLDPIRQALESDGVRLSRVIARPQALAAPHFGQRMLRR
jgi:hypothetical protein